MVLLHYANGNKQFDCKLLDSIKTGTCKNAQRALENVDPKKLFDSYGKSLLHWCVTFNEGYPNIVCYLIQIGCDVNAQDNDGNTPLWYAVEAGQEYAIKALIRAKANIQICNEKGENPLTFVLSQWTLKNRNVVTMFLNNLRDKCGGDKELLVNQLMYYKCPIFFVVLLRDVKITRMMLDRGCSISARCHREHEGALHEAVAQSDFENVKLLVEWGANVNELNNQDKTPLHQHTITMGRGIEKKQEIIKFLIANGAALSSPTQNNSPMESLMKDGYNETVHTLLQINGIDWRAKYSLDMTALHFACSNDNHGIAASIRLFRGKNFDINAMNSEGETALMRATKKGLVNTVRCLLEMGADVNITNQNGLPALCLIYIDVLEYYCHPAKIYHEIVDLLLFYGTDARYFSVFLDKNRNYDGNTFKEKSVLARLAELEVLSLSTYMEDIRSKIGSEKRYKKYLDLCKRKLGAMKLTKIYESITLLDLLNGICQKKLLRYARKPEFRKAYETVINTKIDSLPHYYCNTIKRRVAAAIFRVDLEKTATFVISEIIGVNDGHIVAREIISYLHSYDLESLCEVI